MAEYLIQSETLDAIADAINAKTGSSSAMTPAEMVTAIGSISGGGGEEGLPAEYQEVEWIGATDYGYGNAGSYFDTGFIPSVRSGMKIKMAATGTQSQRNFFGGRETSAGVNSAFLIVSFSSAGKIGFGRWGSSVQAIPYDTNFHEYELTATTAKVDNVSYSLSDPDTSQHATKTLHVFSITSGSSYVGCQPCKIAYLQLYDGALLVRNYIPCYRIADGVIGMYDTRSKEFKTNVGTGSFTKGDDVLSAQQALNALLGV